MQLLSLLCSPYFNLFSVQYWIKKFDQISSKQLEISLDLKVYGLDFESALKCTDVKLQECILDLVLMICDARAHLNHTEANRFYR